MTEPAWRQARLIPTSGINGAQEQERRATSALLAVMSAVKEFGRSLTKGLGAHAGEIETFIEVEFDLDGKKVIPDGLIRVTRGSRVWTALVEVKTGRNDLQAEQLENYLEVARRHGMQAVLTISNETPVAAGVHPTKVDKRKLRKVDLHHWSWSHILAEAVMQKEHRGVADPDQAWILGELIRYLEHPRSGALEFDDMGPAWVPAREAVAAGTLRPTDPAAADVASRFEGLLRFVALQLGRQLGTEVVPALSRKDLADPAQHLQHLATTLASDGVLYGGIRIPNAVGPLMVTADLRANRVTCHIDLDAPREGRPTTRVNWLIRQLRAAPDTTRIEAFILHGRGAGTADLLRTIRDNPGVLVADPAKELRSFRVALSSPLGTKRGRGRGSFIDSIREAVDTFYGDVLQYLKAWTAAPPRLRETPEPPPPPVALSSTSLSSQDGPEAPPPPVGNGQAQNSNSADPNKPTVEAGDTA